MCLCRKKNITMSTFNYQTYPFKKPPELSAKIDKTYDIVVVGGGPVGLTLALSLAKQDIEVLLLESSNQIGVGSRAICFAKRSLEIFDKLGVAKPMIEKGVQWNVGRIFFKEDEIDRFDLSPEKVSKYPAFINLQQYYVEQYLIDAVLKEAKIDVRWLNKVVNIEQNTEGGIEQPCEGLKPSQGLIEVEVETPEGHYSLKTKYLIACDGSKSTIRNLMGLEMHGERFEERFLIADFKMEADFPSERWFWFDPPFARGQSILLHKQPDNLWRLDFKLGRNAASSIAQDKDFIREKIKSVVGERPFELDWTSIYSFSSKKLDRFVHKNVVFVGDSAHVVSPFGARGANSGIEDADNLSWKLAKILIEHPENIGRGGNPQLLETYNAERTAAAAQNIACTGQSNTFIAPQGEAATTFRNGILEKAKTDSAYKKQINCGRLSVPNIYGKYPNNEDSSIWHWRNKDLEAGRCVKDFFLDDKKTYLIEKLKYQFTLLIQRDMLTIEDKTVLKAHNIAILEINHRKNTDLMWTYELGLDTAYLITPDQYILGRWKDFVPHKAIDLMQIYLSGAVYDSATLQKSEQELIDEEVFKQLYHIGT
jgi:3-(3-hydroxy-phenyl)propionate hydroxylase